MSGVPIKTNGLPVSVKTVATATMTELAPNAKRCHFYTRRETDDFYIAFQNTQPSGITEMMLVDATVAGEYMDGSMVCESKVWVYHTKGSNLDIKYREGIQA